MIEIKDLSLTFKNADEDHEALKAVTLDIPEGCIYGFVGSNGAGKSTLLRVISGIYRPDSGSVTIDKTEVYDRPQAKENIFFVSDETVQFSRLSVNDLKGFFKLTYPRFDEEVFDELDVAGSYFSPVFPSVSGNTGCASPFSNTGTLL